MFRVQTYPVQVPYGAIFVWHGKMISVTVHNLFYQPMDENIKTWTFRFPAKKNPLIRRRHFWICWPIVLQYDVKAICKMFMIGHEDFSHERSLNQPKATRVCIRSINQSNCSILRLKTLNTISCSTVHICLGHIKGTPSPSLR